MPKHPFCVYLAGPISGCNKMQIHRWRDQVRDKFADKMDFIDPTARLRATSYQIVEADIEAIEEADGMLVNMWRESIGSALGMVHAHRAGKPVVVADPNHLGNRTLNFYATALAETPYKAADALLRILRAEAEWTVVKGAAREAFNREKLAAALRKASRGARRNNIVAPVLVLPRVIAQLDARDRKVKKLIHAADIHRAVIDSLRDLAKDPEYAGAVKGIADKWRERAEKKRAGKVRTVTRRAAHVEIRSGKSHSTIWGPSVKRITDIPSADARTVLQTIMQVEGITRITLGHFSGGDRRKKVCATVRASKQSHIIEGKIFDAGKKGTMQTFQVRIQHADTAARILADITDKLKASGRWAK